MNKNACYLLLVSMSLAGCNANELESESDSMENFVEQFILVQHVNLIHITKKARLLEIQMEDMK